MAKQWRPGGSGSVGTGELVGRRLHDFPELRGAVGQPKLPESVYYTQFEETRAPGDVSLDRLGRANSVEEPVRDYLVPRCLDAQGNRQFEGWATIRVKELLTLRKKIQLEVVASAVAEDPDKGEISENIYHAHVPQPATAPNSYFLALHLKTVFVDHGKSYPLAPLTTDIEPAGPTSAAGESPDKAHQNVSKLSVGFMRVWSWLVATMRR